MRISHSNHVVSLLTSICMFMLMNAVGPAAGQTSGQLKFPYQAIVLHDDALVSSGPGRTYYATEKLGQGDVVEVHHEDPGGWCAIRPIEGSFSLVPEATLEIVEQGVGRILENGTQAWVGTKLGAVDTPMWQIKLQKNELVTVLGQASWPNPDGHSTIWYQISPPAGEFRWIRISDIQLPIDVSGVRPERPNAVADGATPDPLPPVQSLNNNGPAWPPEGWDGTLMGELSTSKGTGGPVQQATLQTEQPVPQSSKTNSSIIMNQGWRQTNRSISNGGVGGAAFQRGLGSGIASDGSYSETTGDAFRDQAGFSLQPGYDAADNGETIRIASADAGAPGLARNLDAARSPMSGVGTPGVATPSRSIGALELQLTDEMLKSDPSQWRLQDLEIAANAVYRTTLNSSERILAEQFLAKVNNCKRIQAGFQVVDEPNSPLTGRPASGPIGSGVKPDLELGSTYDAHGWLTELVRNGGNARSEYALQDGNGNITHHVAPAPGMNLRRYLKSRVGVIGKRGYHSELKLDHVTAHRVIELEKPKSTFPR